MDAGTRVADLFDVSYEIPQRPDRLIIIMDDSLREHGVPHKGIAVSVAGQGPVIFEIFLHWFWKIQEEDELLLLLREPLHEDSGLEPLIFAWFDGVLDLEAAPRYFDSFDVRGLRRNVSENRLGRTVLDDLVMLVHVILAEEVAIQISSDYG